MANKKTFTPSTKDIAKGNGNLQFNTSTPAFREKVQLFFDGIHKMNDQRRQYQDKINDTKSYLENVVLKEREVSSSKVDEINAQIESYRQAVREITADILERMPTYNDVDKNLFYAYRQYINDECESSLYNRAFTEWLDAAGIVPTDKGISWIMEKIGVKKASSNDMIKSGGDKLVTNLNENTYLDLVYRIVAQMMRKNNLLTPYEYEYKIRVKAKANANA